jgi:hypothetical protein
VTGVPGVGSIGTPLTATEVGHPPVDGTRSWRAIALHGTYACRAPRWLGRPRRHAHRCAVFFTSLRMLLTAITALASGSLSREPLYTTVPACETSRDMTHRER